MLALHVRSVSVCTWCYPLYSNLLYLYTDRKLVRLMEADGLNGIETLGRVAKYALYPAGLEFTPTSSPNSSRYDGSSASGVYVTHIGKRGGATIPATLSVGPPSIAIALPVQQRWAWGRMAALPAVRAAVAAAAVVAAAAASCCFVAKSCVCDVLSCNVCGRRLTSLTTQRAVVHGSTILQAWG